MSISLLPGVLWEVSLFQDTPRHTAGVFWVKLRVSSSFRTWLGGCGCLHLSAATAASKAISEMHMFPVYVDLKFRFWMLLGQVLSQVQCTATSMNNMLNSCHAHTNPVKSTKNARSNWKAKCFAKHGHPERALIPHSIEHSDRQIQIINLGEPPKLPKLLACISSSSGTGKGIMVLLRLGMLPSEHNQTAGLGLHGSEE